MGFEFYPYDKEKDSLKEEAENLTKNQGGEIVYANKKRVGPKPNLDDYDNWSIYGDGDDDKSKKD